MTESELKCESQQPLLPPPVSVHPISKPASSAVRSHLQEQGKGNHPWLCPDCGWPLSSSEKWEMFRAERLHRFTSEHCCCCVCPCCSCTSAEGIAAQGIAAQGLAGRAGEAVALHWPKQAIKRIHLVLIIAFSSALFWKHGLENTVPKGLLLKGQAGFGSFLWLSVMLASNCLVIPVCRPGMITPLLFQAVWDLLMRHILYRLYQSSCLQDITIHRVVAKWLQNM